MLRALITGARVRARRSHVNRLQSQARFLLHDFIDEVYKPVCQSQSGGALSFRRVFISLVPAAFLVP